MIVCGLLPVALRTIEQLHHAAVPIVVLDDDVDLRSATTLGEWGIPLRSFGAEAAEALRGAGLAGARAVVCAQRSDLATLETALLAAELRPGVRVVVHLDNPSVGRAVERITGRGSVLDVAELFAPAVINGCLGRSAHDLDLGGTRFVAAEVTAERAGTLRDLYGALVPLGVLHGEDPSLVVCPGRDHAVEPGDRVTLLDTPAALEAKGVAWRVEPTAVDGLRRRASRQAVLFARGVAKYTDRAVRRALVVGLVGVACSMLFLHLAYKPSGGGHLSLLQGAYFTVETAATVGFGDFSFANQAPWLQAYGIALIIAGTTLVSLIFALVTNVLVSRRIEQSLGRGRVGAMRDHVVMIGLGAVGMRVLEGLVAHGRDVVVIERDENSGQLNQARALHVPVVVGDATRTQTLEAVNLRTASAVAVMTSDDLTNLEAGLAVRDLLGDRFQEVPVLLRVFDRGLGNRLERHFGFGHVWSTSALAAPWFVGAAIGLDVLDTFYVANEPFLVAHLTVAPEGGLAGLSMREVPGRIRVLALRREDDPEHLEHPPRRETRFAPGDGAYLAGPYDELLQVLGRERARD